MKILLDMNLSPSWVAALQRHGWDCAHWSSVGDPLTPDPDILAWAHANGYVILTYDLDFGTILAMSQAHGPSVVQIRSRSTNMARLENLVVSALRRFEPLLDTGALLVVDEARTRALALPLRHP